MSGTVLAMRQKSEAPARTGRPARVGVRDLVWLTWRRHRWSLVLATAVTLAAAVTMLVLEHRLSGYGQCGAPWPPGTNTLTPAQNHCLAHRDSTAHAALTALHTLVWLPTGITLLWAVPLLAREFETGTVLLAWGQDVSPRRWVATRAAALLGVSVLLTAALGLAARSLDASYLAIDDQAFVSTHFETGLTVLIAYTVLVFAVGLAAGFVVRRTLPALVVAGVGFAAIRFGLRLWRPHFLSPVTRATPVDAHAGLSPADLVVSGARLADAAGHPVRVGSGCSASSSLDRYYLCLQQRYGAVDWVSSYQPAARLHLFQLIEAGLSLLPALALLAVVVIAVRPGTLTR